MAIQWQRPHCFSFLLRDITEGPETVARLSVSTEQGRRGDGWVRGESCSAVQCRAEQRDSGDRRRQRGTKHLFIRIDQKRRQCRKIRGGASGAVSLPAPILTSYSTVQYSIWNGLQVLLLLLPLLLLLWSFRNHPPTAGRLASRPLDCPAGPRASMNTNTPESS